MKGPVFIVSVGRSGTSLFASMLNSHPNLAIPGESWYMPQLYKYLINNKSTEKGELMTAIINLIKERGTFPNLGITEEELRAQLSGTDFHHISEVIAAGHLAYQKKENKKRWGDKTPYYFLDLDIIHKLYPDAYIIHIVRDGRDVALSISEANKKKYEYFERKQSLAELAVHWKSIILKGRADAVRLFGNKYYEIKYEDLLLDTEAELKKICQFIDEEYSEKMLNFKEKAAAMYQPDKFQFHTKLKQDLDAGNQQKWKTRMTHDEQVLFTKLAGNLLSDYGYEQTNGMSLKAELMQIGYHLQSLMNGIWMYSKRVKNRFNKILQAK